MNILTISLAKRYGSIPYLLLSGRTIWRGRSRRPTHVRRRIYHTAFRRHPHVSIITHSHREATLCITGSANGGRPGPHANTFKVSQQRSAAVCGRADNTRNSGRPETGLPVAKSVAVAAGGVSRGWGQQGDADGDLRQPDR